VQLGVVAQVLAAGQLAVEQRVVAQVADPPARRPRVVRQLVAQHPRHAGVRPQQRRQHAQQRRLPGAVGAQHRQRLPSLQPHRHPGQRHPLAVAALDAVELQRE
jgi:hypothetical protein